MAQSASGSISIDESRKRVAILVPNPCNPDYRIVKHAETFQRNGYDVRVYCRWAQDLPTIEVVNNVTYIRKPITGDIFVRLLVKDILLRLGFRPKSDKELLAQSRKKNHEIIKELDL